MPAPRLCLVVLSLFLSAPVAGCTGSGPADRRAQPGPGVAGEAAPVAKPEGRALAMVAGPVRVEVLPQYELLDRRPASLEINALIRLRGEGEVVGERPPLDLAVILDRSGSMAGEKLRAVKQATLDLLKELRPGDHLTLITYESEVEVLTERIPADAAGIEAARAKVLAITDRGGTALGPGLYRGLEILGGTKRADNILAHVMLLSDGQANAGERDPQVLGHAARDGFRRGISVSTLGVGFDYNEELMTRLADHGGGRYHFIQGTEAIPQVLSDEFAGLVATVASGITLSMRMAPGVRVVQVHGYAWRDDDAGAAILVGSLAAQQSREIVVRLAVEPGAAQTRSLGLIGLRASDQTQAGLAVAGEVALALPTSAVEAELRGSERTEVTVRVAEVESAAQLKAAAVAVDGGDYDKARQVLRASVSQLETQQAATPSPKLARQIDELKQAESGLGKASESAEEAKIYKKAARAKAYEQTK